MDEINRKTRQGRGVWGSIAAQRKPELGRPGLDILAGRYSLGAGGEFICRRVAGNVTKEEDE